MAGSEIDLEVELETEKHNDIDFEHAPLTTEDTESGAAEPVQDESRLETEPQEKLIKLPLSRIRGIMKTDPDVKIASHDAVIILAKAAVRFSTYFNT